MKEFLISNGGLIINMAGSILIVISIGHFSKEFGGSTTDSKGKEYQFAYVLKPKLLHTGLILMVIGFVLQINWSF